MKGCAVWKFASVLRLWHYQLEWICSSWWMMMVAPVDKFVVHNRDLVFFYLTRDERVYG